jgi:hypothetical protein
MPPTSKVVILVGAPPSEGPVSPEVRTADLGVVLAPSNQVVAIVIMEPQESPTALTLAGMADASDDKNYSRSFVRVCGDLHAWGGPWLQWAYRRDPDMTILALDDEVEAEEWRSLHSQVGALAWALTNALSSLRDAVPQSAMYDISVSQSLLFLHVFPTHSSFAVPNEP